MAGSHKREYLKVLIVLFVLTVIEVALPSLKVLPVPSLVLSLILLALVKAFYVAYFYMHLKYEAPLLRRSVYYCLSIPAVYAIILVAEGAWRMA
jgi:cytochrome c oxidase subunit 4